MDNNTETLPPQNDFWKGVLIGGMAGMVLAIYAWYITDSQSKEAKKDTPLLKPSSESKPPPDYSPKLGQEMMLNDQWEQPPLSA